MVQGSAGVEQPHEGEVKAFPGRSPVRMLCDPRFRRSFIWRNLHPRTGIAHQPWPSPQAPRHPVHPARRGPSSKVGASSKVARLMPANAGAARRAVPRSPGRKAVVILCRAAFGARPPATPFHDLQNCASIRVESPMAWAAMLCRPHAAPCPVRRRGCRSPTGSTRQSTAQSPAGTIRTRHGLRPSSTRPARRRCSH